MTFLVNKYRNYTEGTTSRFGLMTMLSLVLGGKVALLLTGAASVPGGPGRRSTERAVETSSTGLPIQTGRYTMTPLGALWSRIIHWCRNRTPRDDTPDEDQVAPGAWGPDRPHAATRSFQARDATRPNQISRGTAVHSCWPETGYHDEPVVDDAHPYL